MGKSRFHALRIHTAKFNPRSILINFFFNSALIMRSCKILSFVIWLFLWCFGTIIYAHLIIVIINFYLFNILFFRFTPKNLHQHPTVALLCGPHVQGAQGISCGRHLANHEVEVVLFLPNFVKMLDSVTSELTLFSKTSGKQVSSIKGGFLF